MLCVWTTLAFLQFWANSLLFIIKNISGNGSEFQSKFDDMIEKPWILLYTVVVPNIKDLRGEIHGLNYCNDLLSVCRSACCHKPYRRSAMLNDRCTSHDHGYRGNTVLWGKLWIGTLLSQGAWLYPQYVEQKSLLSPTSSHPTHVWKLVFPIGRSFQSTKCPKH